MDRGTKCLSKVIKAPIWKEDVHRIETPNTKQEAEEPKEKPSFDVEAQERMMAEIAAKEAQASQILEEAKASCDRMKREAQQEHDKLLSDAREEIDSLRGQAKEAGHKEGFEAGHAEGREQALREMEETIREANEKAMHTLRTARDAADDYMKQAEHDVADVVMHVVEKVLPQHFIDVPQVILPAVKQALLKVKDQSQIDIHVSPDCYEFVLMARDEFRSMLVGGNAVIEVISDESLHAGDCLIETPNGAVDARLATQLELIRQAVQEILP